MPAHHVETIPPITYPSTVGGSIEICGRVFNIAGLTENATLVYIGGLEDSLLATLITNVGTDFKILVLNWTGD